MKNGFPTLAICGPGRSGKDTACEWFRDNTPLTFVGGCSWSARHYMASRLSQDLGRLVTAEEAYASRHEDRMKWYAYLNEYRAADPARLVRDVLQENDLVCGIRDFKELLTAQREGLLDLTVWVDRAVQKDPTLGYTADYCDITVMNHGSKEEFYDRLRRLFLVLKGDV